ncbi:MAG TPA: rhodanese-like domain-containing protein, partial [Kofleriaceae bacterium]|nr:rhodanese-like domain-containing protein [Kofleriaceae bacterium]
DRVRELAAVAAPRKSDPIVVYCASATCKNSHEAALALSELGYANVRVYAEGKADWEAAGLPLER